MSNMKFAIDIFGEIKYVHTHVFLKKLLHKSGLNHIQVEPVARSKK